MCNSTTTFSHLIIIDKLKEEVYPATIELINNAHQSSKIFTFLPGDMLSTLSSLLIQLKDEVESLFLYEKRLVFPAIYNISVHNKSEEFLPDVLAIKKLMANKEEKIRHYINDLNTSILNIEMVNDTEAHGLERELKKLRVYFEKDFFSARAEWLGLLNKLEHKYNHQKKPCKNKLNGMCCCQKDKKDTSNSITHQ